MLSRLKTFVLPLYAVLVILIIAVAAAVLFAQYYLLGPVRDYQVFLPAGPSGETLTYGSWAALSDASFFSDVRDRFVEAKADFMEANLSTMQLTVYKNGKQAKEFSILTKGREGSWWETPAGLYRVEGKIRNHFSGFAGVYLPWSMPFQGNFFIHGWPYYPGGEPVTSQYSGGCIRLATADAEEVYGMIQTGTPVLVFEKDFTPDGYAYRPNAPAFEAVSYLAADLRNNFVFTEKASEEELPIASITKLMTAVVAVEYLNIEKEIIVPESALASTSLPRLRAGQSVSLYNLLPLLLMESSNEAAVAIANHLGPIRFVELMNRKAQAIGMLHTHFTDPSGASSGNVSTARDLMTLGRYLYNNRSFILNVTRGELDTRVYGPLLYPNVRSFNGFTGNPEFLGGKVGLTGAAGQTLFGIFNLKIGEEKRPVVVVVLNALDNFREAERILAWIKAGYAGGTQ